MTRAILGVIMHIDIQIRAIDYVENSNRIQLLLLPDR